MKGQFRHLYLLITKREKLNIQNHVNVCSYIEKISSQLLEEGQWYQIRQVFLKKKDNLDHLISP